MSTAIRVVPQPDPEVTALAKTCQILAKQSSLDRFEIAVKSRLERGINDDNELRITDELLHQVVLGGDQVKEVTEPTVSLLFARHREATAEVKKWIWRNDKTKKWEGRWGVLREALDGLILKYKAAKRELERRQNEELARAAEEERRRKEAEARAALRNGDVATAKAAMQAVAEVVTPVVVGSVPLLDNTGDRQEWVIEVTNSEAVLKNVAAGIIPFSALKRDPWDITFLKKEISRRGGLPANWTGISVKQVDALTHRR
jgi:hypothetical protein